MRRQIRLTAIGLSVGLIILPLPITTTGFEHVFSQDNPSLAPFVPIGFTAAQRFGARGVGIDIYPQRIAEANANAERAGVQHLVQFVQQDAMTVDVSEATVVTLYLLSSSNLKLRPLLTSQLAPGARIVSHAFSMGDWEPDVLDRYEDERGNTRSLYLRRHDGTVRD